QRAALPSGRPCPHCAAAERHRAEGEDLPGSVLGSLPRRCIGQGLGADLPGGRRADQAVSRRLPAPGTAANRHGAADQAVSLEDEETRDLTATGVPGPGDAGSSWEHLLLLSAGRFPILDPGRVSTLARTHLRDEQRNRPVQVLVVDLSKQPSEEHYAESLG